MLIISVTVVPSFIIYIKHLDDVKSTFEKAREDIVEFVEKSPESSNVTEEVSKEIREQEDSQSLSFALKELGQCLDIKTTVSEEKIEPVYENLIFSLKSEMGEIIMKNEEWTETIIQTNSGIRKKIRLELDYSGQSNMARKLNYYEWNNDLKNWIETDLNLEQSEDPSDALISSLISEGEIVSESRLARVYFQNGEDLTFLEKEHKIVSFEMSHNGKVVKCQDLNKNQSGCSCF